MVIRNADDTVTALTEAPDLVSARAVARSLTRPILAETADLLYIRDWDTLPLVALRWAVVSEARA
jgi:hypothetical protein